jgi:flavodoxin
MAEGTAVGGRSAAVVFSTRFGNTEKIARSLESGLMQAGLQTLCLSSESVAPASLRRYDLICVGGPTEAFSASKSTKEFLNSVVGTDLGGKLGFAFDTKIDSAFSGSAAKYIEHALDDQGLHLVAHRQSALVTTQRQKGAITGATLKDGEQKRFEDLGVRVGKATAEFLTKFNL